MSKIPPVTKRDLQKIFKKRSAESKKGDLGKVLIIAGCKDYPGAAAYLNGIVGDSLKEKYGYGFIASDFGKEIARTIKESL